MRLLTIISFVLLCGTVPALAKSTPFPPLSEEDLNSPLELGDEIEMRADGDLNGDGDADTAYIVSSPDRRELNVLMAQRNGDKFERQLVGKVTLQTSPLGPATLSIAKGVLKVEDLTGGTTAMSAVYRYRYDAPKERMRMIGLDGTMYSRTYAHDGFEMSWNMLTFDMMTVVLHLNEGLGDAAYDKKFEQHFKWMTNPVYMEDTLDPEMVMIDVRKK